MKSFLSGRSHHDQPASRPEIPVSGGLSSLAKNKGHAAHANGGGSPTVECIKQGDKVTRLIVTCSCGERIEVDCLYPAGS